MTKCQCPSFWWETLGGGDICYFDDCPAYESCGGWTWDPPCGGCDTCIAAQLSHCDDGPFRWACSKMQFWSKLQAACA